MSRIDKYVSLRDLAEGEKQAELIGITTDSKNRLLCTLNDFNATTFGLSRAISARKNMIANLESLLRFGRDETMEDWFDNICHDFVYGFLHEGGTSLERIQLLRAFNLLTDIAVDYDHPDNVKICNESLIALIRDIRKYFGLDLTRLGIQDTSWVYGRGERAQSWSEIAYCVCGLFQNLDLVDTYLTLNLSKRSKQQKYHCQFKELQDSIDSHLTYFFRLYVRQWFQIPELGSIPLLIDELEQEIKSYKDELRSIQPLYNFFERRAKRKGYTYDPTHELWVAPPPNLQLES